MKPGARKRNKMKDQFTVVLLTSWALLNVRRTQNIDRLILKCNKFIKKKAFHSLQYSCQGGYHIHVTVPRTTHVLMHNSAGVHLFAKSSRWPRGLSGIWRNNKVLTCFHLQSLGLR